MSTELSNNMNVNNTNRWMVNGNEPNLVPLVEKPCPATYIDGSFVGWNAAIVGLLSCILAMVCLLTCLYYMAYRRRYMKDVSECPSPVALVEKSSASPKLAASTSQIATAAFVNETGKETKINASNEQTGTTGAGDFGMATIGNGHASPSRTNGLLANGNTDQSELRLLQHEDH